MLLPQPGVGLGEHLPDLGVVEEFVDLFESSPAEPQAMGSSTCSAERVGWAELLTSAR